MTQKHYILLVLKIDYLFLTQGWRRGSSYLDMLRRGRFESATTLNFVLKRLKMAKRDNLKSVAHNFGHSFLSLMNWENGHYIEDFLLSALIDCNNSTLSLDIKNNIIEPGFLTQFEPIQKSIHRYCTHFFHQSLATHGFSLEKNILEATMTIEYDFATMTKDENCICTSYKAVITLVDERSKSYTKAIESYTKLPIKEYNFIKDTYLSKEAK